MSPFKSEKQRKFLWMKHPKVAKRWSDKYGSKPKPEHYKRSLHSRLRNRGER